MAAAFAPSLAIRMSASSPPRRSTTSEAGSHHGNIPAHTRFVQLLRTTTVTAATATMLSFASAAVHADVLSFDHNQSLVQKDFSGRTDLVGAVFTKANCQSSNFHSADLTNANIEDANFSDADLSDAKLLNSFGTKTKFIRAKLTNTRFDGANLIGARFDGADIAGADFSDAIMDAFTVKKLCTKATGENSSSGVSTRESLMCP